jgi:hypothetical protein
MTIKLAPGDYTDTIPSDFVHYFHGSLLLWKLTSTKNRIFIPREVTHSAIKGVYLTKEKEWKDKSLPYELWPALLTPIAHYVIGINFVNGCGIWTPDMFKNLKKSLKCPNADHTRFHGVTGAEDLSTQNILYNAFPDVYASPVKNVFTLKEAINSTRNATISTNFFILERRTNKTALLFFKKELIGIYTNGKIFLDHNGSERYKSLLCRLENIPPDQIEIIRKAA